jgi:hypothetical protein
LTNSQPPKTSEETEISTDDTQRTAVNNSPDESEIPVPLRNVASSQDAHPQTVIRFRRPVLASEMTSGMTDSYETLTLSEVQQLDAQREADIQLQLEELQLALGDFDEVDEFEELDEFEDDWEDGVDVDGEWDVEGDDYCGGEDCGEEFIDDRY